MVRCDWAARLETHASEPFVAKTCESNDSQHVRSEAWLGPDIVAQRDSRGI